MRNSAKAIIVHKGRLLATRNVDAEGDWYLLPGGGQQHGEPLPDALRRECREELGADVRVGPLRLIREYIVKNHEFAASDADSHQIEFMFECELAGDYEPQNGPLPDTQQTGVAWLPIAQLETYRLYPKALIPLVKAGLETSVVYLGDVN